VKFDEHLRGFGLIFVSGSEVKFDGEGDENEEQKMNSMDQHKPA
jgi:hypothetical protein